MTVPKGIYGNNKPSMQKKNNLRTIETQIVQKVKNEPRPKLTGSYKKSGYMLYGQEMSLIMAF